MYLLFSDIHANRQAAQQIERLAGAYERLFFAGDLCGYGEDWAYVIDLFIELGVDAVRGNHDEMVLDESISLARYPERVAGPILQTRRELSGPRRDYLDNLPTQLDIDGQLFIRHTVGLDQYCHEPEDCLPLLSLTDAPVILIGHTHIQRCFQVNGRTIVNPGSITRGRSGHSAGYATLVDGQVTLHETGAPA
jgi:putative phosphoesterase